MLSYRLPFHRVMVSSNRSDIDFKVGGRQPLLQPLLQKGKHDPDLACPGLPKITLGLIYQSNVETSADPSAKINLRQSSRVIYETFVCRQSHRTKDLTLINVAAENNRNLNITPLKTPRFRSLAPKVYDTEKHNPAKKRK